LEGLMKKQLLSVSALVAVGMLLAPVTVHAAKKKTPSPTITLGGYTVQGIRHGDSIDGNISGAVDTGGFAQFGDSEIYFNLKAQLDNGIKISGTWQLEGDGNSVDGTMDEHHFTLSGSFGSIKLGQGDNVGQMMTTGVIGSFATQVGLTMSFDRAELVQAPTGYSGIGNVQLDQANTDAPKISYRTPRVGGLQLGVSWGRDITGPNGDAAQNQTANAGVEDMRVVAANFTQKNGRRQFHDRRRLPHPKARWCCRSGRKRK
jgi:outer membrane protein OmpU